MFDELDTVVLVHDIDDYGLKKGDLGTIVHLYKREKAAEVEFIDASGKTRALLTLKFKDVRPMARNEILHVRPFASV